MKPQTMRLLEEGNLSKKTDLSRLKKSIYMGQGNFLHRIPI